jgi:hypothetical protein
MILTPTQTATFVTYLTVTNAAEFATWVEGYEDQVIADAMNAINSPDFWVWRTKVTKEEITGMVSIDGTSFTWTGNGFIGRTVQELLAWQELFSTVDGTVNPSLPHMRAAFADIFSGTGNAASNRAHLAVVGRRKATRFERLFATGTGSAPSPGVLMLEGELDYLDIARAFGRGGP